MQAKGKEAKKSEKIKKVDKDKEEKEQTRKRKDKKDEKGAPEAGPPGSEVLPSASSAAEVMPKRRRLRPATSDAGAELVATSAKQQKAAEPGSESISPKQVNAKPRIPEVAKAARIDSLRNIQKVDKHFMIPDEIPSNKMSWTVYPPESLLAELRSQDSEVVPSAIQVLLVGSFYINYVSELHAKAVNEFHKTSIKVNSSKNGSTLSWGVYGGPDKAWWLAKQLALWEPLSK